MRGSRTLHKWLALMFAIPLVVIFVSGLGLSLSPNIFWLQPHFAGARKSGEMRIGFAEILRVARSVPEAAIDEWRDVRQVDVRPVEGLIKVRGRNDWEIQIDAATGAVLGAALRRKTWLIRLHDGSLFGPWMKFGVFLPAGIAALVLWVTGLVLFAVPQLKQLKQVKKRRRR